MDAGKILELLAESHMVLPIHQENGTLVDANRIEMGEVFLDADADLVVAVVNFLPELARILGERRWE